MAKDKNMSEQNTLCKIPHVGLHLKAIFIIDFFFSGKLSMRRQRKFEKCQSQSSDYWFRPTNSQNTLTRYIPVYDDTKQSSKFSHWRSWKQNIYSKNTSVD